MLKKASTLLIIYLLCLSSFAQDNDKRIERAKKRYENKEYVEAIAQFRKLYSEDKKAYIPVKYIANSYRKINKYEQAETFYTLVVNSIYATAEDHLNFGQTLRANGKLAAAKEQFEKFAEKSQNRVLANLLLQSMDEVKVWESEPKNFIVEPGEGLNTEEAEYGLVAFRDKFYITSNREKDFNSPEAFSWDGSAYMSIYEIDTSLLNTEDGKFSLLTGRMNSFYHDGPLTLNKAQNKCVIMRIDNEMRGKDFINRMKLYEGEFEDGKWKNFKELPFNSDAFHTGHPSYGKDENELFFISDRTGGQGGMDLYRVERSNGAWGEVQNLGPTVNTSKNESFPYYRNNKLFYSSNGFLGYGGYDLFVSENKGTWQAPKNLKTPINSTRDDFGIYFITDSTGYYSSNRDGGKGKDDIYKFVYSEDILTIGLSGILEYKTLPVSGTKILMLDANDSIVAYEYTDSQGRFRFKNLPYNEDVILRLETDDLDLVEDGRLYLTDDQGAKIKLLNRLKNGKFTFRALQPEEIKSLALLELQDSKLVDALSFKGLVYNKLPGDFAGPQLVYLVDKEGTIIDSVYSDNVGKFKFQKLGLDDGRDYFVRIPEGELEMTVALINEAERYYKLDHSKDGKYILAEEQLANTNAGYTGIVSRLETYGKPLPYTKVNIYDAEDNIVATVFTNEFGEFQYNKLKIDNEYYFRAIDIYDETSLNTKLYVIDKEGDPLFLIKRLIDARYAFTALPYDEYLKLRKTEESSVPKLVALKGQIFKKLQGDFSDTLKVYLLDEGGNIIDSMYTDKGGYFNFEKLDADRSYSFRLNESKDMNLALLDEDNLVIEQAVINEKGNFSYKRLTYQVASFNALEMVDAELIENEQTHEIFGQVYQKLPGDFVAGMEVYIYNDEGEVVGTAFTDKNGKFKFKKLNPEVNYYFKIEHHEEDFQLITLDENSNVTGKTIKNQNGRFKYTKLQSDKHVILMEEEEDHHQIIYFDKRKIELDEFTVYYRFDSLQLNTASKIRMQEFADLIRGEPFKVEVHSYTDKRGSPAYNKKLSKARTDNVIAYLATQGLRTEDLIGNYYGELNPVVNCETQRCDNDDHALNRRTVVKLIKIE